jgi:hypothetical protein
MSIDYYVYIKNPDAFSVPSFEQYCSFLGLRIELHPSFNLLEDAGFSPIRLIDTRFFRDSRNHDFLSGFELNSSEYQHILQPRKNATGFLHKLFKAKPIPETPYDRAIKDATRLIELRCGSADSFEVLLAYIFGAYLIKCCGGAFDDPQTGQFYDDHNHLESEIRAIIADLLEQDTTGELLTHE